MASPAANLVQLFLFFLVAGFAYSSHIANEVLGTHGSIGRSLLEQKTRCPLQLETMNMTLFLSTCRGPNYTVIGCCSPLEPLLCPVKDQINDSSNDCAKVFFFNLSLYTSTPPGFFATLCKDGDHGLRCEGGEISVATMSAPISRAATASSPALVFTLFVGISLMLRLLSG